jgi:hypothetical protein
VVFLEHVKHALDHFVPETVRHAVDTDPDALNLAKKPMDVTVLFLESIGAHGGDRWTFTATGMVTNLAARPGRCQAQEPDPRRARLGGAGSCTGTQRKPWPACGLNARSEVAAQ